jgi:anti-anti-sigma regulatory factor
MANRRVHDLGGACLVKEEQYLDMRNTAEAKSVWENVINSGNGLIIDLSETTLIQGEAIRAIASVYRKATEQGNQCLLIASSQVKRIIGLLPKNAQGLLPPMFDSEVEAIASLT